MVAYLNSMSASFTPCSSIVLLLMLGAYSVGAYSIGAYSIGAIVTQIHIVGYQACSAKLNKGATF